MILFILFLYFFTGGKAPVVPSDTLHIITTNVACMECHAPGKQTPLKAAHTPKDQCLDCHKVKKITPPVSANHI